MLLSQKKFNELYEKDQLMISLIGMSGIGKSYRGSQLVECGFNHICCDDLIAQEIEEVLTSNGVKGLASWMGQPYTEGYRDKEQIYLSAEEKITQNALQSMIRNTLIDTTGSVIYLSDDTLSELKRKTLIVYLETDWDFIGQLFHTYLEDPKPVIWGDIFQISPGMHEREALAKHYPELLKLRATRYGAIADVCLPFRIARDQESNGKSFLSAINNKLHAIL